MRLTHLSPLMFGENGCYGGGERYALALAQATAKHVDTKLMSLAARGRRWREGPLSIELLPLRTRWKGSDMNPLSEALLARLCRADAVHAHQYESLTTNLALILGRLSSTRVSVTDLGGAGKNYRRPLRLGRLVHRMLALSEFGASLFPELADRVTLVYGGVDTDAFCPQQEPRERSVVFVGRVLPHKGVHVLVEAMPPDVPLHIVGRPYDPSYGEVLQRLAGGKRVHFHEQATDADVVQALRSASVAVLPSVHRNPYGPFSPKPELLGLTLLEAMACATPVICSRTAAMPEFVDDDETGLVVEAGNPAALRAAIERLLSDPVAWRRMSEGARVAVEERFTWDAVAQRCLAVY
jgi:glycosyltransferase involved in cell wall biosynthesis